MNLLQKYNEQEAVLAELDEQELQLQKELKNLEEQRKEIMCEVITRTDVITEALLAKGIKKVAYLSKPYATTDWLKAEVYIEGFTTGVSLNIHTGVLLIEPVK